MVEGDELSLASQTLGRRIERFDDRNDELSVVYEALPGFCNRHGTVQGGFLSAMLDSATALGLLQSLPAGKSAVTRSLTTQFLKPASPGQYIARVRPAIVYGAHATVFASLSDDTGVVVATAVADLRIIEPT